MAAIALLATAAIAWADGPRYVYEIQEPGKPVGSAASQIWSENVGVVAEAARLYIPVTFSKKAGSVSFTLDATFSFSSGASVELERSAQRVLVRHEVLVQGAQELPKPDRRSTQRFSLSDIIRKGGKDSGSPLTYALRKAISESPYKAGKAWIESATYDSKGRFIIVVGLKKS
jgi:hypothetical protein